MGNIFQTTRQSMRLGWGNERWQLNLDGLWMLCRQHVYHDLVRQNSKEVREQSNGIDTCFVHTNFDGFLPQLEQQSAELFHEYMRRLERCSPREVFALLVQNRSTTEGRAADLRRWQERCSKTTMHKVAAAVELGETGVKVAKFVRDASASTFVVGASFLTVGAGTALLAIGSGLKGIYRYQDTCNFGSALIETLGTFVVGFIPLPIKVQATQLSLTSNVMTIYKASKGNEALGKVIMFIGVAKDAALEGGKSFLEGSDAKTAFTAAAARLGTGIISGLLPLDKLAIPVVSRLFTDTTASLTSDWVVGSWAKTGKTVANPNISIPTWQPRPKGEGPHCDAYCVLSTGNCDAAEYIRQFVLRN